MAKKKGKPQPRKSKKKRASSFMSSVKKMLLGAFAVVVCFIGVLFIYNWFYPVSKTRPVEKKQDRAETIVRPVPEHRVRKPRKRRKTSKRRTQRKRPPLILFKRELRYRD